MPRPDAVAEVARGWLRRGAADLGAARTILDSRGATAPWTVTFHAQQAVEKHLKAALVIEQVVHPRTHELERLSSLLPSDWDLPDQETLSGLSLYAVAGRYPGDDLDAGPEPTWADAEEAVGLAETVRRRVLAGFRARDVVVSGSDAPDTPESSDDKEIGQVTSEVPPPPDDVTTG